MNGKEAPFDRPQPMDRDTTSSVETSALLRIHTHPSSKSVTSLPDMSATLQAKVAASEEEQSVPHLLARVYDQMAVKFLESGLNLQAVEQTCQYFTALDAEGHPKPLSYNAFPAPLPPFSVRLSVLFFQDCNVCLTQLVHAAAQDIMAHLPPGTKCHLNNPSHYHITLYMTSQPHTLRPDPFNPAAVIPHDVPPEELLQVAAPHPHTLQKEIKTMRQAAAGTPAPSLAAQRFVLADSGTLLLCNVDSTGHVARLRRQLSEAFPGGPPRQSTILHASVARLLTPRQLSPEERARVQAACDRWTERVQGLRWDPHVMWHVSETEFTTVEGPRVRLPFKGVE